MPSLHCSWSYRRNINAPKLNVWIAFIHYEREFQIKSDRKRKQQGAKWNHQRLFFLLSYNTMLLCSACSCYPIIWFSKRVETCTKPNPNPVHPVFRDSRLRIFTALIRRNTFGFVTLSRSLGIYPPSPLSHTETHSRGAQL